MDGWSLVDARPPAGGGRRQTRDAHGYGSADGWMGRVDGHRRRQSPPAGRAAADGHRTAGERRAADGHRSSDGRDTPTLTGPLVDADPPAGGWPLADVGRCA